MNKIRSRSLRVFYSYISRITRGPKYSRSGLGDTEWMFWLMSISFLHQHTLNSKPFSWQWQTTCNLLCSLTAGLVHPHLTFLIQWMSPIICTGTVTSPITPSFIPCPTHGPPNKYQGEFQHMAKERASDHGPYLFWSSSMQSIWKMEPKRAEKILYPTKPLRT